MHRYQIELYCGRCGKALAAHDAWGIGATVRVAFADLMAKVRSWKWKKTCDGWTCPACQR